MLNKIQAFGTPPPPKLLAFEGGFPNCLDLSIGIKVDDSSWQPSQMSIIGCMMDLKLVDPLY